MKVAGTKIKIAVGAFVLVAIAAAVAAVLMVGNGFDALKEHRRYDVWFRDASGLQEGAPVKIGGLTVGRVVDLRLEFVDGATAAVAALEIVAPHFKLVRENSQVVLQTQGVLGDKYAAIVGGTPDSPEKADGTAIAAAKQLTFDGLTAHAETILKDFEGILRDVHRLTAQLPSGKDIDGAVADVRAVTRSLRDATGAPLQAAMRDLAKTTSTMAAVAGDVQDGRGTLGLLVNDPSLYDDARALLGKTNRSKVARTLVREAVKDGSAAPGDQGGTAVAH